jgi:hypothetical protein
MGFLSSTPYNPDTPAEASRFPEGWMSGTLPLQPEARTRRFVRGVMTSARPLPRLLLSA